MRSVLLVDASEINKPKSVLTTEDDPRAAGTGRKALRSCDRIKAVANA
jgi:hypothetical protein